MLTRNWWVELPFVSPAFNFKWQPVSRGIKFASLTGEGSTQVRFCKHAIGRW